MTLRHNPPVAPRRPSRQRLRLPSIAAAVFAAGLTLPAQDPAASDPAAPAPAETTPAAAAEPAPAAAETPASPENPAAPETSAPAGEAPVAPAPDAPAPVALLGQAREKLAAFRTLKAVMTETIDFGPARRFKAAGEYLQAAGNKVRVDLKINVGKNEGRLLQVSDGDVLWNEYVTGSDPKVTRRDLRQILAAAKSAQVKSTWLAELGLGGLPALLAAVEGAIDFEPTMKTVIEGRDFYVLEGTWKPALRQQFEAQLAQSPSPPNGPKTLPAHVPDLVRLYLDAETLFPYRIRYLKQSPAAGESPRPLLTLDFRDIVANAAIDPERFRYPLSEKVQVVDTTRTYLDQLTAQAAQAPAPGSPAQSPPAQAPPAVTPK